MTAPTRPGPRARGRARRRTLLLALLALVLASAPVARGDGSQPGSYCPFPEDGKKPKCLEGPQERYAGFFEDVESGAADPRGQAELEADLGAGEARRTWEAVSSLAYGYYLLARRAAASPDADPELTSRLERWNRLLARAYNESPPDGELRRAVATAASDLEQRAPGVEIDCDGDAATDERCHSTVQLVQGLRQERDSTGVRGQLGRLLQRIFGDEG